MSVGERICELRATQNLSQGQLAEAMGVTRQAVSKWENDLSSPDTLKLIQLAEVLDTDVEYLATGRNTVRRRPPVVLTKTEVVENRRKAGRKNCGKSGGKARGGSCNKIC